MRLTELTKKELIEDTEEAPIDNIGKTGILVDGKGEDKDEDN